MLPNLGPEANIQRKKWRTNGRQALMILDFALNSRIRELQRLRNLCVTPFLTAIIEPMTIEIECEIRQINRQIRGYSNYI